MLPTEIKKKPLEYVFLLLILIVFVAAYLYFSYSPYAQRRVVYLSAGAYFYWSIIHHYNRGDLTLSIVLEYLIVALFAVILISTSLF